VTSTERLPSDYVQARARFLAAARERGAEVSHHDHPLQGPGSELLATDVARFGRADAPARLLVISGTHGIEGFAGSACQSAWLESGDLPARDGDVGIVVVHAINPFGFAWLRRVNEDNVDLNRNVVDFASPPENQGYDALADAIVPRRFDDPAVRASADETLLAFAAEHGFDALQDAVSRGQYRHPHGVFYGGTTAVWSQRTLEAIVRRHLTGAERVGVIDLHTGLGPFGYGEVMASHPDAAGKARLASWYGDDFTIRPRAPRSPPMSRATCSTASSRGCPAPTSPASRSSGGRSTSWRSRTRCAPTRGCMRTRTLAVRRPSR
jgi:hypothetical protein